MGAGGRATRTRRPRDSVFPALRLPCSTGRNRSSPRSLRTRAPRGSPESPRGGSLPLPTGPAGAWPGVAGIGAPGASASGVVTQHVDVSDAQARAAPPSLSECRPGRGGGERREGAGGRGDPGSRCGPRAGPGLGLRQPGPGGTLGGPLGGRRGCSGSSPAGLALSGALSLRHSAHPAPARVSRLQLGQARSPAAAAPARDARRRLGSPFFFPSLALGLPLPLLPRFLGFILFLL